MSFPTIEDYAKAIEYLNKDELQEFYSWEKSIKFSSLKRNKENNLSLYAQVQDDIFSSLLNMKGEIEIQGKIFKVNAKDELILVYSEDELLKIDSPTEKYSFGDDVLSEVFDIKSNVEFKDGCAWRDLPDPKGVYYTDYGYDCKYQTQYRKFGIYFTLSAEMWLDGTLPHSELFVSIYKTSYWEWLTKKETVQIGITISAGNVNHLLKRFYSKAVRLKEYELYVTFTFRDYDNGFYLPVNIANTCQ